MTTIKNMHRFVALAAATAAVLAASACGSDADEGEARDAANSTAATKASATPTPAATRAPARPKTITSACKLLPADVVVKVLGSSNGTKLDAKEQPVEQDGAPRYNCVYGNGGREVLSLITTAYPDRADTATETIDAVAEGSHTKTTRIDGVGADAVAYTDGDVRVLAFAVPYGKELRLSVLTGPSVIPQGKYQELAQRVASHL